MHKPYIASCEEYIPQALEVADTFHVVKKLNDVLGAYQVTIITQIQIGQSPVNLNFEFIAFKSNEGKKIQGSTNLSITTVEKLNDELVFTITGRLGDNLPSLGSKSIKVERLVTGV
jgi:transposase